MSNALFDLLPAIHRLRDGEGGPLQALLAAIARELDLVGDDLDQLLDDMFVETAAPWALPYIGALVGYEPLAMPRGQEGLARAEVAQTVALRRRKGTLAAIEAVARNATGWPAKATEYFPTLARTQYMNRALPEAPALAGLRDRVALAEVGSAFDTAPHHPDVRRIATGGGRHNIPDVGVFVWPVRAFAVTASPAVAVHDRRFRFSPLGHDIALFHRPLAERDVSDLARPINVPRPISRLMLERDLALPVPRLYGPGPDGQPLGLVVAIDGVAVPAAQVRVCRLDDDGATWLNLPASGVVVDPELGRLALPASAAPRDVRVSFHHGFSAPMGGGEYARAARADDGRPLVRVPDDAVTLADALALIGGDGIVELRGADRYAAPAALEVAADGHVTIRAATDGPRPVRPVLELAAPLALSGGASAAITLDGLLILGAGLEVPDAAGNLLDTLTLTHCTLVPGHRLTEAGAPADPAAISLSVARAGVTVTLDASTAGAIQLDRFATLIAADSIIDACDPANPALVAPDGGAGGTVSLDRVTLIGRLHATEVGLISDSLLLAGELPDPAPAPVHVERRQQGCIRYSWLPPSSRTPRRFRCLPDSAGRPSPYLLSRRFGTPAYARLDHRGGDALLTAASDEGEIGAFAGLGATRLRANLAIRLAEHIPAGAEAGVFQVIEGIAS